MPRAGALAVVGILVFLVGVQPAYAADPGGDTATLGVTVIDPSATPTPSPTPATPGGGGGGTGGGGSGGGGTGTPPVETPQPSSTPVPDPNGWIVVSGFDSSSHAEFNPLRGWVDATITIANRSKAAVAKGTVTFRLFSPFGAQLGPAVTRDVGTLKPGDVLKLQARLPDVGQWPLVRVTASFAPEGTDSKTPIVRESWVLTFPWLVLVAAVLAAAVGVIVRLRPWSRP
ncbi:MAG: hypothetical protein DI534_06190 [Leifsonia xyli]|nr:MAG: hypothetical protein DI534_06190 [Leifsonia xyli]